MRSIRVLTPIGPEEEREDSLMRRSLITAALLVPAVFAASSAMAQAPALSGEMTAMRIVHDEEKGEVAVPAEKVYPNDTVEYTLRYMNSGTATAAGIDLVGPVPAGTVYIDETATDTAGIHPVYSIDEGKTWHEAPVWYEAVDEEGNVVRKKATPDMITHVKWSMAGQLQVGEEVNVSYRVHVR